MGRLCCTVHAILLLLLKGATTGDRLTLYLNFECYYDGQFCMSCTEGVLSRIGDYNLTVVGSLNAEVVKIVYDANVTTVPLLLDSYFSHQLNDHLQAGAIIWTTSTAQAAAAAKYLVQHNRTLKGPVVRDFTADAGRWRLAIDSEQWFWQREGKRCGEPGMCG